MVGLNKDLAQIFTPEEIVTIMIKEVEKVIDLNNIKSILEPSVGEGVFIDKLIEFQDKIDALDIDQKLVDYVNNKFKLKSCICNDTLTNDFIEKYDLIIGNPPYGVKLSSDKKQLYKKLFDDVHVRTVEIYNYFISKCLRLLNQDGILCFIIPNTLLFQNEYENTRKLLLYNYKILKIINLGDGIFEGVDVPSCIIIVKNDIQNDYTFEYVNGTNKFFQKKSNILSLPSLIFGVDETALSIINKIKSKSICLGELCTEVSSGISTGADKVFVITDTNQLNLEQNIIKNVIAGRDVAPYKLNTINKKIIYLSGNIDIDTLPITKTYLLKYKENLCKRNSENKIWWKLHRPRKTDLFNREKIFVKQTSDKVVAVYDTNEIFSLNSVIIIKLKNKKEYKSINGVINSTLSNFVYRNFTQEKGRTFAEVKPKNLRKLYIPTDETLKENIEKEVNEIISNYEYLESGMKNIDQLMFDHYGFSTYEMEYILSYMN